jgi:hypothetical protein
MSSPVFRSGLLILILLCEGMLSHGGITSYTDKGKTDFDTALHVLNPYGTWSKIDGLWAYTPLDHSTPYTHGRWLYTEYGWYWQGSLPHSWATEHYGYWKRGADKIWSWYPGTFWLPQTVEIRATPTHIGWRSAEVDQDGNFVEQPLDRYTKWDEWTFVTMAQFANPITPATIAKPDQVKELLEDSTDSGHSYFTYREIPRPGPHPADFLHLASDGGMFAPKTMQEMAAVQPPVVIIPGYKPYVPSTNSPAAQMTGTNAPALLGEDDNDDPNADKRQVKYWITMSLPTFWTPRPPDAKAQEIYLYRPDFYQDNDGIERRITLWFNPNTRTRLQDVIAQDTPRTTPSAATTNATTPASPAVPASAESNPFESPLDDSFRPSSIARPQSAPGKAPVPSGLNPQDAPAPLPAPLPATNAAP